MDADSSDVCDVFKSFGHEGAYYYRGQTLAAIQDQIGMQIVTAFHAGADALPPARLVRLAVVVAAERNTGAGRTTSQK